jgi:hypothetical protein
MRVLRFGLIGIVLGLVALLKPSQKRNQNKKCTNRNNQPTCRCDSCRTSIYPVAIHPSAEDRQRYENEYNQRERQITVANYLNWITGIAAGVAGASLVILYFALDATRIQATAAKTASETAQAALKQNRNDQVSNQQAFKEQMRPYVSTTFFTMANQPLCPDSEGIHVCANVHITNSGRTPAVGIQLHRYATFGPNTEQVVKALKIPRYTVPSGTALAINGPQFGTAFTKVVDETTAKGLLDGSIPITVYGVVQYFDIFDEYHETGFCAERVLKSTTFITCEYGNWFDRRPGQKPKAIEGQY